MTSTTTLVDIAASSELDMLRELEREPHEAVARLPRGWAVADIDFHDEDGYRPTTPELRRAVEFASSAPVLWRTTRRNGLHLVYRSLGDACAAVLLSACEPSPMRELLHRASGVETGRTTRTGGDWRIGDPAKRGVWPRYGDSDSACGAWATVTRDDPAVDVWLAENGLHDGRNAHELCPLSPSPSHGDPVVVGETGVTCHKCGAMLGWGQLLDVTMDLCDRELTAQDCLHEHLWYDQAVALLSSLCGEVRWDDPTIVSRGWERLVEQYWEGLPDEDARLELVSGMRTQRQGVVVSRDGVAYTSAPSGTSREKEHLTRWHKWRIKPSGPKTTDAMWTTGKHRLPYLSRVYDIDGEVCVAADKWRARARMDQVPWPEYGVEIVRGAGILPAEHPRIETRPLPLTRKVADPWAEVARTYPGLDGDLLRLYMCAIAYGQARGDRHAVLAVHGCSSGGKTTHMRIAMRIVGVRDAGEVSYVAGEEKQRQALSAEAMKAVPVMFLDEWLHERKGYAEHCRHWLTQLDRETFQARVLHRDYQPVRLGSIVFAGIEIPTALRYDTQFSRRTLEYQVVREVDWRDSPRVGEWQCDDDLRASILADIRDMCDGRAWTDAARDCGAKEMRSGGTQAYTAARVADWLLRVMENGDQRGAWWHLSSGKHFALLDEMAKLREDFASFSAYCASEHDTAISIMTRETARSAVAVGLNDQMRESADEFAQSRRARTTDYKLFIKSAAPLLKDMAIVGRD